MTEAATPLPRARALVTIARERSGQGLIFVVLLGLFLLFSVMRPSQFPTAFNLRSLGLSASVIALLAVGQTFVIIGGGIDLSVGSVLVFSGVVAAKAINGLGAATSLGAIVLVGTVVGLGAGASWGAVNGFLAVRGGIPDFIVTLGTFGMAYGLAAVITGGSDITTPLKLTTKLGNGNAFGVPWLLLIALVAAIVMQVVLTATRFGRYTYAVGSNREAGRRVGVKVDRQRISLYMISGGLAGLGGFLALALYNNTTIGAHGNDNLVVIAAVVIGGTSLFGGTGSVLGTIAGVLVPVVLQNGFVIVGVPTFWQPVAIGAVLIAAVYIDGRRRTAAR
ncbi:MAG: ABC transporter permease [Actinomycetota bacterium]